MKAISFENVSFAYENDDDTPVYALTNVSFDVEEGEFVALCGGNGSGKSTLSKLMNGLLLPDAGSVSVFGEKTTSDENEKDDKNVYNIRSTVGLVFQNPDNQMVASIIEDDIAFGPENLGVPREEIEERITWSLKVVGMETYRKHTPSKLSGGQKQRIAIAGILAMKPRVLVLDESTSMLDPEGRVEVMETLKKLNQEEGITIIHVTHNMDECAYANRALVLKNGKLVFEGTPDELFANPTFVKDCYLELPPLQNAIYLLAGRGVKVNNVHTERELAEKLWQLKSEI